MKSTLALILVPSLFFFGTEREREKEEKLNSYVIDYRRQINTTIR